MGSNRGCVVSGADKGLTPTPAPVCTRVCTSNPENDNADADPAGHQGQGEGATAKPADASLESLADALLTLSPADRAKLAALLAGQQADSEGNDSQ